MTSPLKQIAEKLLPDDHVAELMDMSHKNTFEREQVAKEVTANMLIGLGQYTRHRDGFKPHHAALKYDADESDGVTTLQLQQQNSSESFDWATRSIHAEVDRLAERAHLTNVFVVKNLEPHERDIYALCRTEELAERYLKELTEEYGNDGEIESRQLINR